MSIKTAPPKLLPGTVNLINQIENEEIRKMILLGLHPSELVDGFWYALASKIVNMQRRNKK